MADSLDRVADQVSKWRDELIDLTRRNRLLNALGGKTSTLRIREPGFDQILSHLGLLEGSEGSRGYWRFHYPPSEDLENADTAALEALRAEDPEISDELEEDELLTDVASALVLSRRLRTLERTASTEFMDKGIRTLYIGIGLLHWAEAEDEWQDSPVVLVPISLERPSPREPFQLRATEDDPVLNPALRVKLENDFSIVLPELESLDDLPGLFASVRAAVADEEGWILSDEALLGRFSFHKEAMYQDLRSNMAQVLLSVLVRALAGDDEQSESFAFDEIPDDELDDAVPPETLSSILDADSTQRRCIIAARQGHSFVMDGPPGTGKSQTIANVIAELLSQQKSVLFVSEKAAALDVVKTRLDGAGLGSYVLELHSHKATRKEVAQVLGAALSERPRTPRILDAAELEQAHAHRAALSAFAAAQNEVRQPFGRSLHWAIGRHAQLADVPTAPPPSLITSDLSQAQYVAILALAGRLSSVWGSVESGIQFLWRDLRDANDLRGRRTHVEATLLKLEASLAERSTAFEVSAEVLGLPHPPSWQTMADHLALIHCLEQRRPVPSEWLINTDLTEVARMAESWAATAGELIPIRGELDTRSSTWRAISSSVCTGAATDTLDLSRREPSLILDGRAVSQLTPLSAALKSLSGRADEMQSMATSLRSELGLPTASDLPSYRHCVELGMIGLATHRPERAWFDPEQLAQAKTCLAQVRPIIDEFGSSAEPD